MLTLSRHFGALTSVWVVSLTDWKLTPQPGLRSSTMTADSEFDKRSRNFSPGFPNQYLYPADYLRSGHVSACLGRNQLFPGLIGLSPLDAGHASDLKLNTANGPPRNFRHASTCPRLDRLASGRTPMTPRACTRRATPSEDGYAPVGFPVATIMMTLASP